MHTLGTDEVAMIVPVVAIVSGCGIAAVSIIMGTIRRTTETKAREESRREIAAYVAEGSISADDAAKLIASGQSLTDALRQRRT